MGNGSRPVVFVHGLWLHSTSWQPWVDLFAEEGYAPIAPEWPGIPATVREARTATRASARAGVAAVTDHFTEIISGLPDKPIVVGHSFGGLIVQKLLGAGHAAAAVAIDPAPIKGVLALPFPALKVASIALRNPANIGRAVGITREQFHYGFGNALPEEESAALFEAWTIPTPGRPLFEVATANLSPGTATRADVRNAARGPLLLVSGGRDHAVPPAIVHATKKRYASSAAVTELVEFGDRGHSLVVDHGWREIAEASLAFLRRHDL
jgi:pimeloyl-ACP methyl ester carboxylesterase